MNAAIRDRDGCIYWMPKPARHGHIIRRMAELGCKTPIWSEGQGFMTDDMQFKTRAEMLTHLRANGWDKKLIGSVLTSEDLW